MLSAEAAGLRAERLRVALVVLGAVETGAHTQPAPLVPDSDLALAHTASPADIALARACLDAEGDMRCREWGEAEHALARGWFMDWPFGATA